MTAKEEEEGIGRGEEDGEWKGRRVVGLRGKGGREKEMKRRKARMINQKLYIYTEFYVH